MIAKLEKVLLLRPYIILILLVVLAFANSFQNSFVWDDYLMIVNNSRINLPAKEMLSIFTAPLLKSAGAAESLQIYYRPILSLYFILNYKIWGMNPAGFHFTGILLYVLTVLVLYRVSMLLFSNHENGKLISLVGASIFAVHPVNSEMAGRAASGEILFGFFIILSLYFFLREKKCLSLPTFALALLSKEAAVMLPFALVILSIDRKGLKKGLLAMIPYVVIIGAYLILRAAFVDTILGNKIEKPVLTRILTMSVATLDYIKLFIIPYPLSPHYPERWYASVLELKAIFAILVLILIFALAFKLRKDKLMLFLLIFPFVMLTPVIWRVNTFPIGSDLSSIANRFLYVSLMPFSLFISASFLKLSKDKGKRHVMIGWITLTVIFMALTFFSNKAWENNLSLFTKLVREFPDLAMAHANLGTAYYEIGRINEAIEEYKTAGRLRAELKPHYTLGLAYYSQGKIDEAVREFNAALRPPLDAQKFDNVYQKQQDKLEKADLNNTLWAYQPYFADIHFNLGRVYLAQGNIDKAMRKFKVATILKPDFAEAHYSLGAVYHKQGNLDEAVKEYQIVLKLNPNHADTRHKLEILQKKLKNE